MSEDAGDSDEGLALCSEGMDARSSGPGPVADNPDVS